MSQNASSYQIHHSTGTATGFLLQDFFLKLSLTTQSCCMGISVMKDHPYGVITKQSDIGTISR